MPLTNSNTYIEPTAGTSLNAARGHVNNSLRSVLTNFKSKATPTNINITAAGVTIGEVDGMLYRSASTNALYISDSVHVKSSPVGGNFTRVGIGNRIENGIVALGANATSYEIGELVATVSETPGLSSNARLYLCVSNTVSAGSTTGFLDVGAPLGYSIGLNDNATFSGQSVSAIRFLATNQIAIGTNSPINQLEVEGAAGSTTRIISRGSTIADSAKLLIRSAGSSSSNSIIYFGDAANESVGGVIYNHATDALHFRTQNLTRVFVNNNGLDVLGTISIDGTPITASAAEINILDGATLSTTELNYVNGVTSSIQNQLNNRVTSSTDDVLTAGYTTTAVNDGTKTSGSYTPTPLGGNMKIIINGGAFTLSAPTYSGDYTIIIQVTNNASAGAVTLSGFAASSGAFTTTNGHSFFAYITKLNGFASINIEALQ